MNTNTSFIEAAQAVARREGVIVSDATLAAIIHAYIEAEHLHRAGDVILLNVYAALTLIRDDIRDLEQAAAAVERSESDLHYQELFDHLFSGDDAASPNIRRLLEMAGRQFPDYYDPDTTYREDAEAFIDAFDKVLSEISNEIGMQADQEVAPGRQF